MFGIGCQAKLQGPVLPRDLLTQQVRTESAVPTYRELVERYNRNIAMLDRIWARTTVQVRWLDEQGKQLLEEGEGLLLFVRPFQVALTVGKLGRTGVWAGSNQKQYWLFDRQDDVVYIGTRNRATTWQDWGLPLPITPSVVPYLLGLIELDPDPTLLPPVVERLDGYYLIEPPDLGVRLLLDPQSARPVRIDLTDQEGYSVVVCRLSDLEPVKIEKLERVQWPLMASHVELFVPGRAVGMTIDLRSLCDGGRNRRKIKDKAFDFDALVKAHKPCEVVELN